MKLSKSEKRYVAEMAAVISSGEDDILVILPDDGDNFRLAELDDFAETLVKLEKNEA